MNKIIFPHEIDELEELVNNPKDLYELEITLDEIISKKLKYEKNTLNYIRLCFLECVSRQKIHEWGYCEVQESLYHLIEAQKCAKEIQEIYPKINNNSYPINPLVAMQEEANILCELSHFDKPIEHLKEAVGLYEYVRKNNETDEQLTYLTIMNEARIRLELAVQKVNSKSNCIKSIKLSEKAREYYKEDNKYYKVTLRNQLYAISELQIYESYGFEIDNFDTIQNLINKLEGPNSISYLTNDLKLIKLGIKSSDKLDEIEKQIKNIKNESSEEEFAYHESIILEAEILRIKAKTSNKHDKLKYFTKCINLLKNYRENNNFKDKYYENQSYYKEAYIRFLLSKNTDKKHKIKTELEKALDLLLKSKKYFEEIPFQSKEIHYPKTLYLIGIIKKEIYILTNSLNENYTEIENTLLQSLTYFEKRNNKEMIIYSYLELGKLFLDLKNYEKSHIYLKKSILIVEPMRNSIRNPRIRKDFFEKINKLYELMIISCSELNKVEETLRYIELSKNRIFLDKISKKQLKELKKPINLEMKRELDNINNKISDIRFKLKNLDDYNYEYSKNYEKFIKLKKIQEYYILKIKNEFPEFYDYYYNQIINFKEFDLKDKTVIEYYYTDDVLLIFLIENKEIIMKKISLKNNFINSLTFSLQNIIYNSCEENQEDKISFYINEFEKILKILYNILIRQIEDYISNKELIIIPYKLLHNIPFICLKDKDYLLDKYIITIVQSGSSIKYIQNNFSQETKNYLVIGNPTEDLIESEKEAIFISNILETTPILKGDADKNKILDLIDDKQIIHFAGHANFNNENPLLSGLKLSDEYLYIEDIEKLDLNTELIVLSACETGKVSIGNSDEVEGFVKYLHINGTKYIIASLWPISDSATKELFRIFYQQNVDYPERLRISELKLKEKFNIFEWGGFQIYGV